MDFVLSGKATEDVKSKGQHSVYFDNKDKCDRWCTAMNFILDPSPVGYRASMRRRTTQKKQVSFYEPSMKKHHKVEQKVEESAVPLGGATQQKQTSSEDSQEEKCVV